MSSSVAVFTGVGGYFCAGADLKIVATGDPLKSGVNSAGFSTMAPMGVAAALVEAGHRRR